MKPPSSHETMDSKLVLYSATETGNSCEVLISSWVLKLHLLIFLLPSKMLFVTLSNSIQVSLKCIKISKLPILRSIRYFVKQNLNLFVSSNVPNNNCFVCAKTNQMMSVIVYCQVMHYVKNKIKTMRLPEVLCPIR